MPRGPTSLADDRTGMQSMGCLYDNIALAQDTHSRGFGAYRHYGDPVESSLGLRSSGHQFSMFLEAKTLLN